MIALGVVGNQANPNQPVDGIHLRWGFRRELGFPWYGFYLFRRPAQPGRPSCLSSVSGGLKKGVWPDTKYYSATKLSCWTFPYKLKTEAEDGAKASPVQLTRPPGVSCGPAAVSSQDGQTYANGLRRNSPRPRGPETARFQRPCFLGGLQPGLLPRVSSLANGSARVSFSGW